MLKIGYIVMTKKRLHMKSTAGRSDCEVHECDLPRGSTGQSSGFQSLRTYVYLMANWTGSQRAWDIGHLCRCVCVCVCDYFDRQLLHVKNGAYYA